MNTSEQSLILKQIKKEIKEMERQSIERREEFSSNIILRLSEAYKNLGEE
jgi:hypothetical protein